DPFFYQNGHLIDLGTLGGTNGGAAQGINNAGQIIGIASTASGADHAFLYTGGRMYDLNNLIVSTNSLPLPSGLILQGAVGTNDRGQIAAFGSIDGQTHTFLLDPVPTPEPTVTSLACLVLGIALVRRCLRNNPAH